jgi:hypothetical protein
MLWIVFVLYWTRQETFPLTITADGTHLALTAKHPMLG